MNAEQMLASQPAGDRLVAVEAVAEQRVQMDPRLRQWILFGTVFVSFAAVIGTAFSPYLLVEHPAVLLLLAPELHHMVLTAPELGFPLWFTIAFIRRVTNVALSFGLGAMYGERVLRWTEQRFRRLAVVVRWVERVLKRVGAPLLLVVPGYTLSTLAGAMGIPWSRFLVYLVAGHLIWLLPMYFFGEAVSGVTDLIIAFLRQYLVQSTLVCIVLVAVQQLYARRNRLVGPGGIVEK